MAQFDLVADDQINITVSVVNPQEIKSTISSYTTYTVVGEDKDGKFETFRRYSDFDAVRNTMVQRWPGCFVPPLPPKKILNKGEASFVEERRRLLDIFCLKMAKLKHLWYSHEFQIFLRSTSQQIQKTIKNLPPQTNDELISKYDEKFKKLSGKEINTSVLARIGSFNSFVKKTLPMLSNFKEMVQNFLELRSKQSDQFETFMTYLMPEYEKNCLAEYVGENNEGKFIFSEQKDERLQQLIARLKQFTSRTEFAELYYILECEEREIEAFQELFRLKEGYESKLEEFRQKEKDLNIEHQKLMAGKQGLFKSIFKSNLEENKKEVQNNIEKVKLEKENFVFICDISTVILGHFEIQRFREEKSKIYFRTLARIAECETHLTAIKAEIFEHILENHNLV